MGDQLPIIYDISNIYTKYCKAGTLLEILINDGIVKFQIIQINEWLNDSFIC